MPMSPDPHRELHVFWHDGHSLGVDGTEVGVLKEADKVRLRTFLQGKEVKRPLKKEPAGRRVRQSGCGRTWHTPAQDSWPGAVNEEIY